MIEVLRIPRIGVSRGMLIGMDASSATTINDLGELETGNRHPSESSSSTFNDEQGTGRVVSTGRETAADEGATAPIRKRNSLGAVGLCF